MLFLLIFLALDAEITLKDPKATNTVDCLQPFKPLYSHGFRVKIFPSYECARKPLGQWLVHIAA